MWCCLVLSRLVSSLLFSISCGVVSSRLVSSRLFSVSCGVVLFRLVSVGSNVAVLLFVVNFKFEFWQFGIQLLLLCKIDISVKR